MLYHNPQCIATVQEDHGILDLYSRMEMVDGTDLADETHSLDLTGKAHVTEPDGFRTASETFMRCMQRQHYLRDETIQLQRVCRGGQRRSKPSGGLQASFRQATAVR